jgi:HEAT repeat protein
MKPKFVIFILLLALAILVLVFLASGWFRAEKTPAPSVQKTEAASVSSSEKPVVAAIANSAILPSTNIQSVGKQTEIHPQTVEELQALAMRDDADSLKSILAALTNSDPQIREAARDAAVQFGDRTAAPALRAAADQVEDLKEKIALREAADFLELPPLEIHPATNRPASRRLQK